MPASDRCNTVLTWLRCERRCELFLLLLTLAAYLPALHAGFIWDDDRYVTNNPLLRSAGGLFRIWFSTDAPSQYVPLVYTTFWIEHAIWGLFAPGFHLVNIVLHAVNAILLFRILTRLRVTGAWLAAALFALHPVQVESVAWISERKNVLSLLFSLLALQAWGKSVDRSEKPSATDYGRALGFYALALLSKATACTLPVAMLLIHWWRRIPITRSRLLQTIPFFLLGLVMGLIAMWWERFHQGTEGGVFAIGWAERTIIAGRAVWFYLGKLFWPTRLTFIYPQWTVNAADPWAYGGLVACGVAGAAILLNRRARVIGVPVMFFVVMLAPLLGFIMLYTFRYTYVADHYQYFASIGPLALAAAGLSTALERISAMQWLKPATYGALLLTLGIITHEQAKVYHDRGTLWREVLRKNPDCWMAENNLGNFLAQQGQVADAMPHYQRALELKPDYAEAHYNLADAFARQNQSDLAIEHLEAAIRANPRYVKARNNLGILFLKMRRLDDAVRQFEEAVSLHPRATSARLNLAVALSQLGRNAEAIRQLREVSAINPDDAEAQRLLEALVAREASEAKPPTSR